MIIRPEETLRAHQQARLTEAEQIRRDRRLASAEALRRVGRTAEHVALRARLALARAL